MSKPKLQDVLDYACRLGRAQGGWEDVAPIKAESRKQKAEMGTSLRNQIDQIVLNTVDRCDGNATKAARVLQCSRGAVFDCLARHGFTHKSKILRLVTCLAFYFLLSTFCFAALPPMPKALTITNSTHVARLNAVTPPLGPVTNTGRISLVWERSPSATVVAYKVYWGFISGIYTNSAPAGNNTNLTVMGLVLDTTYYFAATALDAQGLESNTSSEAIGKTDPWPLPVGSLRPYIYLFETTLVPGRTNSVQISTNNVAWQNYRTFVGSNGIFSMLVTNSGLAKFYRVKILNP